MCTVGELIEFLKDFPSDVSVKVLEDDLYKDVFVVDLNLAENDNSWFFNTVDDYLILGGR